MDSRCDSPYFFFFKGRGKFLIIFLTKMFNRRTNVALAGNEWCYEQVCLRQTFNLAQMLLANLLIARVITSAFYGF